MDAAAILPLLQPYQQEIERYIHQSIHRFDDTSILRDACEYALTNGGKRFRPALVLMMAQALNPNSEVSNAALAIEYFHTASLIADDMPCMDNDAERRNKPSTHIKFNEATALLASYALIAAGYELLAKNAKSLKDQSSFALIIENVSFNTGLQGASGGQYFDLCPPSLSESMLRDIIHKKTVSLFEISFVLGWLFGGGDPQQLSVVKQVASHFGMAFQIADDFGDMSQDIKNERFVNFANVFGQEQAYNYFQEEMSGYFRMLEQLGLESSQLKEIGLLLMHSLPCCQN
jgi:geranylgeranyl diphosphate synthase type II